MVAVAYFVLAALVVSFATAVFFFVARARQRQNQKRQRDIEAGAVVPPPRVNQSQSVENSGEVVKNHSRADLAKHPTAAVAKKLEELQAKKTIKATSLDDSLSDDSLAAKKQRRRSSNDVSAASVATMSTFSNTGAEREKKVESKEKVSTTSRSNEKDEPPKKVSFSDEKVKKETTSRSLEKVHPQSDEKSLSATQESSIVIPNVVAASNETHSSELDHPKPVAEGHVYLSAELISTGSSSALRSEMLDFHGLGQLISSTEDYQLAG